MGNFNQFGGDWTKQKLQMVKGYLSAYATIMRKQDFAYGYIDAFAGTGYCRREPEELKGETLFPEFAEEPTQNFIEGSARIALQVEPEFERYVFIENNPKAIEKLEALKEEFPDKKDRIIIEEGDANVWLQERPTYDWSNHRAVVFLDPCGMQVEWKTIEAINQTKAIDLWVLFPLGMAVNRLLTQDGSIPDSWERRLNHIFGTTEWQDRFYDEHPTLLGDTQKVKIINLKGIGDYYNERLKSIFPAVADNPKPLYNSTGNPLYMLYFAAASPGRGGDIAVKIAQHILHNQT